jgi:hypothetical protein
MKTKEKNYNAIAQQNYFCAQGKMSLGWPKEEVKIYKI